MLFNGVFDINLMAVAWQQPPLILGGDIKISDQNNCGDLSKKLNMGGGGVNLMGDLKF